MAEEHLVKRSEIKFWQDVIIVCFPVMVEENRSGDVVDIRKLKADCSVVIILSRSSVVTCPISSSAVSQND